MVFDFDKVSQEYLRSLWDPGPSPFQNEISRLAAKMLRAVSRHRDRYLKAWVAQTGLLPTEAVLEERHFQVTPEGVSTIQFLVRRREPVPGWVATNERLPTTAKRHNQYLVQCLSGRYEAARFSPGDEFGIWHNWAGERLVVAYWMEIAPAPEHFLSRGAKP